MIANTEDNLKRKYIYKYAFVICLGSFVFGTELSKSTAFRLESSADGSLHILQTYFLPGMFYLGGISGCILSGYTINWGRRNMLILSDVVFLLGTIPMLIPSLPKSFTQADYYYFLPGRFLTGFTIGIVTVVVPIFLKEISSPGLYGRMWSAHSLVIVFGEVVGQSMCYEIWADGVDSQLPIHFWFAKLTFLLPAIVELAQLFLLIFYSKLDTPKFYLHIGADTECLESLASIYRSDRRSIAYNDLCTNRDLLRYKRATYCNMFSRTYIWAITVTVIFLVFRGFSGFVVLLAYAANIYKGAAASGNILLTAIGCLSCLIAYFLSDRYGRRPLFFYGSLVTFVANFLSFATLIMDSFQNGAFDNKGLLFLFAAIYVAGYWASIGSVGLVFFTEFLPDPGCAIGQGVYWISVSAVVLSFSAATGGGSANNKPALVLFFFIFTLSSFLLTFWSYYTIKETAKKSDYEAMCMYSLDEEDAQHKSDESIHSSIFSS